MLVIIGCCAVVALLLMPVAVRARSSARAVVCSNNLKALGQAYAVCLFNSDGALPDVYYTYLNAGSAYQINLRTPDAADTRVLTGEICTSLLCPADDSPRDVALQTADGKTGAGLSSYAYNVMLPVAYRNVARVPFPVNTVTFFDGDVEAVSGEWQRAPGWQAKVIRPRHGNEANYLYLDGHVEKRGEFSEVAFSDTTIVASLPGGGGGTGNPTTTLRATTTTQPPSTTTTTMRPVTTTTVRVTTTTVRVTTTTLPPSTTTTTLPPATTTTTTTLPPSPPPTTATTTTLPPWPPDTTPLSTTTTLAPTTTSTLPPSTTTTLAPTTSTLAPTTTTLATTTTTTAAATTSTTIGGPTTTTSTTLPTVPFIIDDGDVIPLEACSATILCVGSEIQNGAGGPRIPVEALYRLNNGSKNIITTDVHGGESVTLNDVPAGTQISIGGKCMQYISNQFWSDDRSGHTWLLRDDATVPSIAGYSGQRSIKTYLAPYVDEEGNVTLTANDCILLFELSDQIDYTRYAWADFQDLVVLITFQKKVVPVTTTSTTIATTTTTTTTTSTTTTTTLPPGHALGGRISINPSNSQSVYEFDLTLPNGTHITRDDLAGDTPHSGTGFASDWLEYTGPATVIYVKPKGNANLNGFTVDGQNYPLRNGKRYTITSSQMTVHLYNDKRSYSGRAMGKWWIEVTATNAAIAVQ